MDRKEYMRELKISQAIKKNYRSGNYSAVVKILDYVERHYGIGDEDDPIPKYEFANQVSAKTANKANVTGLLNYANIAY